MSLHENFVSWLKSSGGQINDKLDVFSATARDSDRAVRAKENITKGEKLMVIPVSSTITVTSTEDTNSGIINEDALNYVKNLSPHTTPFMATVLVILAELALGSQSCYAPYLNILPSSYDCLLAWTEEERKELSGTMIETSDIPVKEMFEKVILPAVQARPDLWPPSFVTYDAFLQAACMVQSRAFHMMEENWVTGDKKEGADLYLIPAIDMINHASNPDRRNASLLKVVSAASEDGSSFQSFFVMTADTDIPSGTEVLHTYGDLSDAQLLATYGFIDEDSAVASTSCGGDDSGSKPSTSGIESKPSGSGTANKADGGCDDSKPSGSGSKPSDSNIPENATGSHDDSKPSGNGSKASGSRSKLKGSGNENGEFTNPNNHVLVPWPLVRECCIAALKQVDEAIPKVIKLKVKLLVSGGLLQAADPDRTAFVMPSSKPLSEELMTAVQVMMMAEDEADLLEEEYSKSQRNRKSSGRLALESTLMDEDEDFREMVLLVLSKLLDKLIKRYPTTLKEDIALLSQHRQAVALKAPAAVTAAAAVGTAAEQPLIPEPPAQTLTAEAGIATAAEQPLISELPSPLSRRQYLALLVRIGEKQVLDRARAAIVGIMVKSQKRMRKYYGKAEEGDEGEEKEEPEGYESDDEEDMDDDDDDDDDSEDEDAEEDEGEEEEEVDEAPARRAKRPCVEVATGAAHHVGIGFSDSKRRGASASTDALASDDSDKVGYGEA